MIIWYDDMIRYNMMISSQVGQNLIKLRKSGEVLSNEWPVMSYQQPPKNAHNIIYSMFALALYSVHEQEKKQCKNYVSLHTVHSTLACRISNLSYLTACISAHLLPNERNSTPPPPPVNVFPLDFSTQTVCPLALCLQQSFFAFVFFHVFCHAYERIQAHSGHGSCRFFLPTPWHNKKKKKNTRDTNQLSHDT